MKDFFKNLSESVLSRAGDSSQQYPIRLFIHIPKTAGTSFRTAAESRFGERRVLRDYGPDSAATSRSILRFVYAEGGAADIYTAIESDRAAMLAGHFPAHKYGRLVGLPNTVSIFRDPVEQVVSHYRHAVAHHGYKDSLREFAQRKGIRNIQTRFISNLDPALIGLVGLTERYRETLALINTRWQWRLKYRRKNVSAKFDRKGLTISSDDRALLEALNIEDLALYRRANLVFENSLHCLRQGYGSDPRGKLQHVTGGEPIRGWAFDMRSENEAKIEILRNGEKVAQSGCSQLVSELMQWKVPRQGLMGFELDLALKTGDKLELQDAETGLVLDQRVAE